MTLFSFQIFLYGPPLCPPSLFELMMRCWSRNIPDRPNFEGLYQALRPHVNQWAAAAAGMCAALALLSTALAHLGVPEWRGGQEQRCRRKSLSVGMKNCPRLVLVGGEATLVSKRWKRRSRFHLDERLFSTISFINKLIHFKILWVFLWQLCFFYL